MATSIVYVSNLNKELIQDPLRSAVYPLHIRVQANLHTVLHRVVEVVPDSDLSTSSRSRFRSGSLEDRAEVYQNQLPMQYQYI